MLVAKDLVIIRAAERGLFVAVVMRRWLRAIANRISLKIRITKVGIILCKASAKDWPVEIEGLLEMDRVKRLDKVAGGAEMVNANAVANILAVRKLARIEADWG